MRVLRLTLGYIVILGVVFALFAVTQVKLFNHPLEPWENWLWGIGGVVGFAVALLQVQEVRDLLRDTILHIRQLPTYLRNRGKTVIIVVLLSVAVISVIANVIQYIPHPTPTPTVPIVLPTPSGEALACPTMPNQGFKKDLSVRLVKDQGEDQCIGLSDGNALLDFHPDNTSGDPGQYIQYGLDALQGQDIAASHTYWTLASQADPTNAEPRVYNEDFQVQHIGRSYATLVIVTILSGHYYHDGRAILQGAYVQQKEHNDACQAEHYQNCILIKLIIANVGSGVNNQSEHAEEIADLISSAASKDHSIIGVMSGINSQGTIDLHDELKKKMKHPLPIVAATATDNELANFDNLFLVAPADSSQARTMADYIKKTFPALSVALLYRDGDIYSTDLASNFAQDFGALGSAYQLVGTPQAYKPPPRPDDYSSLENALRTTLQAHPHIDAIYCACFADEVNHILQVLKKEPQYEQLQILGGDAFYDVGDYTPDTQSEMHRLRFTSFTYPDLWKKASMRKGLTPPAGLEDYTATYGKNAGQGQYGASRMAPDTSVAYDATLVLMESCNDLFSRRYSMTGSLLETVIAYKKVIGVTGQITFQGSGSPVNKITVVISVQPAPNQSFYFHYTEFYEGAFV